MIAYAIIIGAGAFLIYWIIKERSNADGYTLEFTNSDGTPLSTRSEAYNGRHQDFCKSCVGKCDPDLSFGCSGECRGKNSRCSK